MVGRKKTKKSVHSAFNSVDGLCFLLFFGQLFCCIDPVDKCYDRDGGNGENEEQDFLRLVFYFDAAERPPFCHLRLIDMVMVVMMVMMS